jgi:hypothetical protein
MKILYTSSPPETIPGGLVFFELRNRVMSRIKTKIWKTYSHAGVVFTSAVTGSPRPWVSYMDEIYGLITTPLDTFLDSDAVASWAIRPLNQGFCHAFKRSIQHHSAVESHLCISEDGEIHGTFDEELKIILGAPVNDRGTNLGYVMSIIRDASQASGIPEQRQRVVEFDDEPTEDDCTVFQATEEVSTDGMLKAINNLLSSLNLTLNTPTPPIHTLISQPHPLFSDTVYVMDRKPRQPRSRSKIYPTLSEERRHAAGIIAKLFSTGLGGEETGMMFEEELETTVLARRGRTDMIKSLVEDLHGVIENHLRVSKEALTDPKKKTEYNESIENIITAEGSLLAAVDLPKKLVYDKFLHE